MEIKVMFVSFISNIIITILKFIMGYISKSKTLIADSIHALSDLSTDIVGIVGIKASKKNPDKEHPFGHGKLEYVFSIFISLFIMFLGIKILVSSFTGSVTITNYYVLIVLIMTMILKYIVSSYLIKKGRELNSSILVASGTESKYDVLSTSLAFIFIGITYFSKYIPIFKYADVIGSIVISALTLKIGIELFIKNISSVIGQIDSDMEKQENITNIIDSYKEIIEIRRITILKYGSYSNAIIDLIVNGNIKMKEIGKVESSIKKEIKKENDEIKYIFINYKVKTSKKD